jgi:hypothetical protein
MSTTLSPQETLLTHANPVRFAMAEIKREIRFAGRHRAATMLDDPPEALARMRVGVFLRAIPWVGQSRTIEILREAGLTVGALEWRLGPAYETWEVTGKMRALTTRQRLALADALRR